jgi:outer membrane lipoprotein-sorting protein
MMADFLKQRFLLGLVAASFIALSGTIMTPAQQLDTAGVIQQVDAAVKARVESIESYTVTEHYAVYRNKDEAHPVAEMTVNTSYNKDTGKSYTIVAETGSSIIRSLILGAILDNEKRLNQPGIREGAWFTSANYEMKLKPGGIQPLNGRECLILALVPRRKAPYLIEGTLWVDSKDGSIVQVQGTASKSSSLLTGPTQVIRQYANVFGFSQAIHARAVSNSFMFGETIVTIEYQNYQVQLRPPL